MATATDPARTTAQGLIVLSFAWTVAGIGGAGDWIWTEVWGVPASPIWRLPEGIWAGSSAGHWVMLAALFGVVPRRTIVALLTLPLVAELLLWWRVGIPAGAVMGLPWALVLVLALVFPGEQSPSQSPSPPRRATLGAGRWLLIASVWFIGIGLLLIFNFDGPVFARYIAVLRPMDPSAPWPVVELAYARIGVVTSVHYLAVIALVRARGPTASVLRTTMVAQLVWFCTDSTTNVLHGAAFNTLMVNLPAMTLFCLAWGLTWRGRDRDRDRSAA